jgi:hypothetical protein
MFFLVQSAHLVKPTTMDAISGNTAWANTAANRTALTLTAGLEADIPLCGSLAIVQPDIVNVQLSGVGWVEIMRRQWWVYIGLLHVMELD